MVSSMVVLNYSFIYTFSIPYKYSVVHSTLIDKLNTFSTKVVESEHEAEKHNFCLLQW